MPARWRLRGLMAAIVAAGGPAARAAPAPVVLQRDLAQAFHTRSPWRLIATQDPETTDYGADPAPGEIHLCLRKGPGQPCLSAPVSASLAPAAGTPDPWAPHYLSLAEPVYPRGRTQAPLLEIVTASLHAGDGGQIVVTQLLSYDASRDAFTRVFQFRTGTNNNQEVRFIADGPLRGDVISATPTQDAPFAYWIEVRAIDRAGSYRRVLRYRSATRYDDGNALPVIDSETPGLERRLGIWKAGAALPPPLKATTSCARPRLQRMELWCG